MSELMIAAARVLTPARSLAPGWVEVAHGHVIRTGTGPPLRVPDLDLGTATVVPGFVDTHVHGGGGGSFDGASATDAATAARAHLRHGTTTMLASLVADSSRGYARSAPPLLDLTDDAVLAGVHLEGPWLSERYAGAHDPALLTTPATEQVDRLLELFAGRLRMVTLAPELPGALDAIPRLAAAGVTVAIGHTDATYAEARAAIDAGARVGTHLFNAMRRLHHREPGPIAALLQDSEVHVELIADGAHLHPAMIAMAAAASPGRVIMVTDAIAAAAAADGAYRLGQLDVTVRAGIARLSSGAIAGSTATMADVIRFAVRRAGLTLEEAVRAATETPARVHGLTGVGRLEPGAHADLVVLDDQLQVQRVMRRCEWIEGAGADRAADSA